MKIGFITKEDPNDRLAYSGTHFSMYQALKQEFGEVLPLGPLDHWYKFPAKLKGRIQIFGTDKIYKYQYDLNLAQKHAAILDKRIEKEKPDVLLGSLVTPEVAFLKSDIPLYLTSDATFPLLQDLYHSHSNLHSESIKNALILEREAFQKAEKLILPLEWLATSAKNHYRIPDSKIEVVPYGGNIDGLKEEDVESIIKKRIQEKEIIFLFVGVRWEEKGGPEAVEIIRELNKMGLQSRLKIIGCEPELSEDFVDVEGFLFKNKKEDLKELIKTYKEAHFFMLPTKAECVGMSFIEAASFALPSIGTNVGGVPEAVIDGETGIIIRDKETWESIADRIHQIWENQSDYKRISENAFDRYQKKMNWKKWGESVKTIIEQDFSS